MGRNRIPTLASYGAKFPHWLTFDLVHGAYGLLRMLLLEDARLTKLAAFVRGTWGGFRGRMGPLPGHPQEPFPERIETNILEG
jgi:hypothetical protein